jgi:DNA-binding PadR family transcriptional regulator
MPKLDSLGQFEQLVLGAVRMIENAYAVPVHAMVEELSGKRIRFAAVYTALDRLEQKGCVESREADPTPQRGHKPKRYYSITPEGVEALRDSEATAGRFVELMRTKPWEAVAESAGPAAGLPEPSKNE